MCWSHMKFHEHHVNGQDEIVCAWKSTLYIKAGGVCMYLFMYACFYSIGILCRISAMILICSSILGSSYHTLYNLWITTGCNYAIKVCIDEVSLTPGPFKSGQGFLLYDQIIKVCFTCYDLHSSPAAKIFAVC